MFDKLVDFLLNIIGIFKFWEVLTFPYYGVIFRLGKPHRDVGPEDGVRGTGLHFRWPFYMEELFEADCFEESVASIPLALTTLDAKKVSVRGVIWYQILPEKVRIFITTLGEEKQALRNALNASICDVVEKSTLAELIDFTDAREQAVLDGIRKRMNKYGYKFFRFDFAEKAEVRPIRLIH